MILSLCLVVANGLVVYALATMALRARRGERELLSVARERDEQLARFANRVPDYVKTKGGLDWPCQVVDWYEARIVQLEQIARAAAGNRTEP